LKLSSPDKLLTGAR